MNFYLKKYGFIPAQIQEAPHADLGLIVVIPCFNEPDLVTSLKSLDACYAPEKKAEVIVVFNSGQHHSEEIKAQNRKSLHEMQTWLKQINQSQIRYHAIWMDNLPQKHAGVGLARKIGMDEAVFRFDQIGRDGIIACFDADSLCDPNYLTELQHHFERFPKTPGCSVYFEHPLDGTDHSPEIYSGILQYELHLRYYNQGLRYCNLPYAFHTIGSSMAVRSSAYQKQGGMNKRKAGEDFYFLHKIISLGNFTELNTTRVIPSPRISDRVPFGTGKAIGDYVRANQSTFMTYNFKSFQVIREFVAKIPFLYQSDVDSLQWSSENKSAAQTLLQFFRLEKLDEALPEIRKNSPNETAFIKRLFVWFDAFRVLKSVHFMRDAGIANQTITEAVTNLAGQGFQQPVVLTPSALLMQMRSAERT